MQQKEDWDIIVRPKVSLFSINLKEIWVYKDLILLLVKRDVTSVYKQTILGPLWMFIQPIFATLIYTFTFGQANLSTDGIPALLFYLIGQTFWNYFSECLNKILMCNTIREKICKLPKNSKTKQMPSMQRFQCRTLCLRMFLFLEIQQLP